MIRPSSLSIAKFCELAPVLSERFPSRNANTDRGSEVDAQVTAWLDGGPEPSDPDAKACMAWLNAQFPEGKWWLNSQRRVELRDPDTGALITAGTPDIVAREVGDRTNRVIVDLKKREQYGAGRLADPDDNDQLHAYALASTPEGGSYRTCLLLFGDGQVEALWSKRYAAEGGVCDTRDGAVRYESWDPILARITAVNDRSGGEPKGTTGPHCGACYPRLHCPNWALPAHQGPTELAPLTAPGGITKDNAGKALLAVMAVEEVAAKARDQLKAWAAENGPIVVGGRQWGPVVMPGRMSVDTAALEAAGLYERFARVGRPFTQFRMTKAKGAEK